MVSVIEIDFSLIIVIEVIIEVDVCIFKAMDLTVFGLNFIEGLATNRACIGGVMGPLTDTGETEGVSARELMESAGTITYGTRAL